MAEKKFKRRKLDPTELFDPAEHELVAHNIRAVTIDDLRKKARAGDESAKFIMRGMKQMARVERERFNQWRPKRLIDLRGLLG